MLRFCTKALSHSRWCVKCCIGFINAGTPRVIPSRTRPVAMSSCRLGSYTLGPSRVCQRFMERNLPLLVALTEVRTRAELLWEQSLNSPGSHSGVLLIKQPNSTPAAAAGAPRNPRPTRGLRGRAPSRAPAMPWPARLLATHPHHRRYCLLGNRIPSD